MTEMQPSPWTDERVALLRKLHAEGESFSLIAGRLGGGLSRNACIGKAKRLHLDIRCISTIQRSPHGQSALLPGAPPKAMKSPREKKLPGLAPSKVSAAEKRSALPALRPPKPVIVPSRVDSTREPATFLHLADDGCMFTLHSVGAVHTFCNQPAQSQSKYCSTHHKGAHDGFPTKKQNGYFHNGDDVDGRKRVEV
jgi:GcrA cell cycle regulator